MHQDIYIVVEGKRDKHFLRSYISYLASGEQIPEIQCICGKDRLASHCRKIEERLDDGKKVLIIFDADDDYENRKSSIEETIRTEISEDTINENPNPSIFLFPNNQSSGELENLLEEIVISEHKKIFDCFDVYKACLTEKDDSYRLPDIKGKIYCYMEALGIMAEERKPEDHFKQEYWNFESPSLDQLRKFLSENIGN